MFCGIIFLLIILLTPPCNFRWCRFLGCPKTVLDFGVNSGQNQDRDRNVLVFDLPSLVDVKCLMLAFGKIVKH